MLLKFFCLISWPFSYINFVIYTTISRIFKTTLKRKGSGLPSPGNFLMPDLRTILQLWVGGEDAWANAPQKKFQSRRFLWLRRIMERSLGEITSPERKNFTPYITSIRPCSTNTEHDEVKHIGLK